MRELRGFDYVIAGAGTAGLAAVLELTDYADACPIAVVALEVASTNEVLRVATDDVFTAWLSVLSGRLESVGIESIAARDLAVSIIALLEGAFILARAEQRGDAFTTAGDWIAVDSGPSITRRVSGIEHRF